MKRLTHIAWVLTALLMMSAPALSAPITVDTGLWSRSYAPSAKDSSGNDFWSQNDDWTGLLQGTPAKTANSSGSLISDFVVSGDFTYTGNLRPTYADNSGCIGSNDNSCNDNDIAGLVFGWQDQKNHYRLGWSQGDVKDITGRTGLYLVREINGASNTLFSMEQLFWQDEITYAFSISRLGDGISIAVNGESARNQPGSQGADPNEGDPQLTNWSGIDFNLVDTAFLNGRIGVYTESQSAMFSNLSVESIESIAIPAPASLSQIALGLILLQLVRSIRKR